MIWDKVGQFQKRRLYWGEKSTKTPSIMTQHGDTPVVIQTAWNGEKNIFLMF